MFFHRREALSNLLLLSRIHAANGGPKKVAAASIGHRSPRVLWSIRANEKIGCEFGGRRGKNLGA
jgi:hypothetical protein